MKNATPHYINVNPGTEDKLANKPHESVAIALSKIITEKKYQLKNKVIGLEGEWGSGKSHVLGILDEQLGNICTNGNGSKNHYIFTYNVWAHQEDITRRSFLEELILERKKGSIFDGDDTFWNDLSNELTAKKRNITTNKFPEIKEFYLWFAAIPLFFVINKFIGEMPWLACSIIFSTIMWWVTLLGSMILSALGIKSLNRSFKESKVQVRKIEQYIRASDDVVNKVAMARLFYLFKGFELTTDQNENIIEDDPSVTRFKNTFDKIISHFKYDTFVIVFDDMDRLASKEKLMSVWSSIFTFFSHDPEGDTGKNIWTIIPYDKRHLTSLFDVTSPANNHKGLNKVSPKTNKNIQKEFENEIVNEFLHKTFATSLRVPTPIVSTWKEYLHDILKEAFKETISDETISVLTTIFKYSTDIARIKPRELINFVNSLVSLVIQHEGKGILIEYLALYSLKKDQIVESPVRALLDPSYCFQDEKYLFEDPNELTASMAALFYNLEKEKASELFLKINIEKSISDNADLEILKQSPQFQYYLREILLENSFAVKSYSPADLSSFLLKVKDILASQEYDSIWRKFNESLTSSDLYSSLEEWHLNVLLNAPLYISNNLSKIVLESTWNKDHRKYCDVLIDLFNMQNERTELKFIVDTKVLSQDEFVYFFKKLKDNGLLDSLFDKSNIGIEQEHLGEFLMDSTNATYDVSKTVNREIVEFLISKGYVFTALRDKNTELISTLTYQEDIKIIDQVLILNRILNTKVEIVPQDILNIYQQKKFIESEADVKACILKYLSVNPPQKSNFSEVLQETDADNSIATIIEKYLPYTELLKLVVEQEFADPLVIAIIKNLTAKPTVASTINAGWVFGNLPQIQQTVFSNPDEIYFFIDFLSSFENEIVKFLDDKTKSSSPLEFNILWQMLILNDPESDKDYRKYKTLKALFDRDLKLFESLSSVDWLANFGKNTNIWNAFKHLLDQGLLTNRVFSSHQLHSAFEEYLKNYLTKDFSDFPTQYILKIAAHFTPSKIKTIADSLFNIANTTPELSSSRFDFYVEFFTTYSESYKKKSNAHDVGIRYIRKLGSHVDLLKRLVENQNTTLVEIINNYNGDKEELAIMFNSILQGEAQGVQSRNSLENLMSQTKLWDNLPKNE